ncbi:hypothetical protein D3C84_566680 [compost metagenome]
MGLQRHEPLLVLDLRAGAVRNAEHQALAGAVDVGVEDADPRALAGQRQRQVGGGGRLADAALARGHGDDVLHPGQGLGLRRHLVGRDHTVDLHRGLAHAGEVFQAGLEQLGPAILEQPGGIAQFQAHAYAATVDADVTQTAGADRVLIEMRIDVLTQDRLDGGAGDCTHG